MESCVVIEHAMSVMPDLETDEVHLGQTTNLDQMSYRCSLWMSSMLLGLADLVAGRERMRSTRIGSASGNAGGGCRWSMIGGSNPQPEARTVI
jgi:hypothetical protein